MYQEAIAFYWTFYKATGFLLEFWGFICNLEQNKDRLRYILHKYLYKRKLNYFLFRKHFYDVKIRYYITQ